MFGLLDYRGWPLRRLQSPRTERMTEKSAVTPTAMSVQMKKKAPLELATRLPCITPFPIMWRTGMTNEKSEARSMMTYPDRRPASTSVPYSQMTQTGTDSEVCDRSRQPPADDVVRQVKRTEEDREQRRDG
jgi:hypothetical protein